ncbi:HDOD domain-containing protein [Rhodoferax sp.]|uniref:HDOD domain-containing protein n=1 Tax=Rhodoferax sp. TaxID=50421 RepID=UPI002745778A|nr:HDOD domain-containing protein [Rhodoferax sp.]
MPTLSAFFESARLPVMTEVAHALIRTLNDESASNAQVEAILAKDPALTANLLRMANSAQFGLSRQVLSLGHAISLVGMSRIRSLALSTSIKVAFPVVAGLDRTVFWKFSMACAAYAQWLAGGVGLDPQQAWLAGMMLRLGELLIGQRLPESLAQIEVAPNQAEVRWQREQRLLGFDEGQVTAVLARHWNFPQAIVIGLQSASDPMAARPFDALAGVVHLAALLADRPDPDPDAVGDLPVSVINALKLDRLWMVSRFPSPQTLVDVTGL